MNRLRYRAALIMLIGISTTATAQRPFVDYRCLARESDYVLVGKVARLSSTPIFSDFMGGLYLANIVVVTPIQGVVTIRGNRSDRLDLLWRSEDSHSPRYSVGARFLLFVKNTESGPIVINGSQGAAKLASGSVLMNGQYFSIDDARTYLKQTVQGCRRDE